jgi:hypothetical protein
MSIKYRYGKPIPERLLTLEEPGKPLLFDTDRGLVAEVSGRHSLDALMGDLAGKDANAAAKAFTEFGRQVMATTIELADGKYSDRTGEIIEIVAAQTGISFPHRLEKYVELAIIGSRPLDRWNIAKATTKELCLQVFGCAVQQQMADKNLQYKGLPCKALCLTLFEEAARKTGDRIRTKMDKTIPDDGVCQFIASLVTAPAGAKRRRRAARAPTG